MIDDNQRLSRRGARGDKEGCAQASWPDLQAGLQYAINQLISDLSAVAISLRQDALHTLGTHNCLYITILTMPSGANLQGICL